MKKDPTPYLEDILESIDRIDQYLSDIDYDRKRFDADVEKQDSVIRRIEIIGEATKRLAEDFRAKFSDIPWKQMAGMRDVLIHEYDEIDLDLVWEVVTGELPQLRDSIKQAVEKNMVYSE